MSAPLTKVDSAIAGLSISDEKTPLSTEKEVKKPHKRTDGVWNIKDLGKGMLFSYCGTTTFSYQNNNSSSEEQKIEITLPIETQKTGWYACSEYLIQPSPLRRRLLGEKLTRSTQETQHLTKLD